MTPIGCSSRTFRCELISRLDSLRARIRPHFLFNTLNSIASLIVSRPETAEQAVEDLSELFRVSLGEDQRQATVADELRLCELYLGIEELRLGERLRVEWKVDDAARDQPMPSLLLQPLVENAIYHGIEPLAGGGVIDILIEPVNSRIEISITNPLTPAQQQRQREGNRMALENIRERLDLAFAGSASMDIKESESSYTVKLLIPMVDAV